MTDHDSELSSSETPLWSELFVHAIIISLNVMTARPVTARYRRLLENRIEIGDAVEEPRSILLRKHASVIRDENSLDYLPRFVGLFDQLLQQRDELGGLVAGAADETEGCDISTKNL